MYISIIIITDVIVHLRMILSVTISVYKMITHIDLGIVPANNLSSSLLVPQPISVLNPVQLLLELDLHAVVLVVISKVQVRILNVMISEGVLIVGTWLAISLMASLILSGVVGWGILPTVQVLPLCMLFMCGVIGWSILTTFMVLPLCMLTLCGIVG